MDAVSKPIQAPVPFNLGGVPIIAPTDADRSIRMLLWGKAGTGKTTLACTAPGNKLILNFDPQGYLSVKDRSDVQVVDFSAHTNAVMDKLKEDNFMGIESVLDRGSFDTVIIDSLTSISGLALENAIACGKYKDSGAPATIERPTLGGYGHRNAQVLAFVKSIMRSVTKKKKHVIFITHEDQPDKDKEGHVIAITLMLGGGLPEFVGLRLSEIWAITTAASNGDKFINIRPHGYRTPVKTRMFITNKQPSFLWTYDPDTDKGGRIEDWYNDWCLTGTRVAVPPPSYATYHS